MIQSLVGWDWRKQVLKRYVKDAGQNDLLVVADFDQPRFHFRDACPVDFPTRQFKFCRKLSLLQSPLVPKLPNLLADDVFVLLHFPKAASAMSDGPPFGSH